MPTFQHFYSNYSNMYVIVRSSWQYPCISEATSFIYLSVKFVRTDTLYSQCVFSPPLNSSLSYQTPDTWEHIAVLLSSSETFFFSFFCNPVVSKPVMGQYTLVPPAKFSLESLENLQFLCMFCIEKASHWQHGSLLSEYHSVCILHL